MSLLLLIGSIAVSLLLISSTIILPFNFLDMVHIPQWLGIGAAVALLSWCMGE